MEGASITLRAGIYLVLLALPAAECVIHGKFVQINDMHYDPTYKDGGISCNVDLPADEKLPYGNYECDAPRLLIESAVHEVNKQIYETDFIMWAGDVSGHTRNSSWLDENYILDELNVTSQIMREGISPEIPIYPMIGNHDYWPKSQLPTSGGLYGQIADIVCPIFNMEVDGGCNDFRKAGYYSRTIENVMLMILNTNLYSLSDKEVDETDPDPAGQFQWMKDKFAFARQNNQMVHVFAHIPPGFYEGSVLVALLKEPFNAKFNQIMRDNHDVIIGIYSAHTHTDSFRIIYKDGEPVVSLLISPSVTPWRWAGGDGKTPPRNPALRVIQHEKTGKMALKDYEQRFLNLEKANTGVATVQWENEYIFSHYKGADNITAKTLHYIVENNFKKSASDDFHKYFERNSVMIHASKDKPPSLRYYCGQYCKDGHICAMMNVDHGAYKKCIEKAKNSSSSAKLGTTFSSILVIVLCYVLS